MDKILTVEDVAAIMQVQAITVRQMFREQRLRAFKMGKSWRTTEKMLQEDVEALARGELPPPLPKATAFSPMTARVAAHSDGAPAQRKAPRKRVKAEPVETVPETPAPKPEPKTRKKEEAPDDSQQLLF
jgi:excisionase family DNA binding protein